MDILMVYARGQSCHQLSWAAGSHLLVRTVLPGLSFEPRRARRPVKRVGINMHYQSKQRNGSIIREDKIETQKKGNPLTKKEKISKIHSRHPSPFHPPVQAASNWGSHPSSSYPPRLQDNEQCSSYFAPCPALSYYPEFLTVDLFGASVSVWSQSVVS